MKYGRAEGAGALGTGVRWMMKSRPVWSIVKWLATRWEPANRAGSEPKRAAIWQREPPPVESFATKIAGKMKFVAGPLTGRGLVKWLNG
jgi:hypothetical protein